MSEENSSEEIPYGYCHCGCGQKTSIFQKNNTSLGIVKGDHARFIKGHRLAIHIRFPARYAKRDSGCWEWTGRLNRQGYGAIGYNSRQQLAHRVSWQLTYGVIPDGLNVLHKCDNPRCVNPDHLFIGTQKDNVHDCMSKGRMNRIGPPSEKAFGAKLTADKVAEIRGMFSGSNNEHKRITQREAGEIFGVSQTTIWRVLLDKAWRCA